VVKTLKYELTKDVWDLPGFVPYEVTIEMPKGARITGVSVQFEALCLWALVNTGEQIKKRKFLVAQTGMTINEREAQLTPIQTLILDDGEYVLHIYEVVGG